MAACLVFVQLPQCKVKQSSPSLLMQLDLDRELLSDPPLAFFLRLLLRYGEGFSFSFLWAKNSLKFPGSFFAVASP